MRLCVPPKRFSVPSKRFSLPMFPGKYSVSYREFSVPALIFSVPTKRFSVPILFGGSIVFFQGLKEIGARGNRWNTKFAGGDTNAIWW